MLEGKFTFLAKDPSDALFAYRQQRLAFFKDLAAAKLTAMYFRAPAARDISLDKRLEMYAGSGDEPPVSTSIHTN